MNIFYNLLLTFTIFVCLVLFESNIYADSSSFASFVKDDNDYANFYGLNSVQALDYNVFFQKDNLKGYSYQIYYSSFQPAFSLASSLNAYYFLNNGTGFFLGLTAVASLVYVLNSRYNPLTSNNQVAKAFNQNNLLTETNHTDNFAPNKPVYPLLVDKDKQDDDSRLVENNNDNNSMSLDFKLSKKALINLLNDKQVVINLVKRYHIDTKDTDKFVNITKQFIANNLSNISQLQLFFDQVINIEHKDTDFLAQNSDFHNELFFYYDLFLAGIYRDFEDIESLVIYQKNLINGLKYFAKQKKVKSSFAFIESIKNNQLYSYKFIKDLQDFLVKNVTLSKYRSLILSFGLKIPMLRKEVVNNLYDMEINQINDLISKMIAAFYRLYPSYSYQDPFRIFAKKSNSEITHLYSNDPTLKLSYTKNSSIVDFSKQLNDLYYSLEDDQFFVIAHRFSVMYHNYDKFILLSDKFVAKLSDPLIKLIFFLVVLDVQNTRYQINQYVDIDENSLRKIQNLKLVSKLTYVDYKIIYNVYLDLKTRFNRFLSKNNDNQKIFWDINNNFYNFSTLLEYSKKTLMTINYSNDDLQKLLNVSDKLIHSIKPSNINLLFYDFCRKKLKDKIDKLIFLNQILGINSLDYRLLNVVMKTNIAQVGFESIKSDILREFNLYFWFFNNKNKNNKKHSRKIRTH